MNINQKRTKFGKKIRDEILAKTHGRCGYCGCSLEGKKFALDHMHPLKKGGADEYRNLIASCMQCNHYKATFTIEQFRENISKTVERLVSRSLTGRIAHSFGLLKENPCIEFFFEKLTKTV